MAQCMSLLEGLLLCHIPIKTRAPKNATCSRSDMGTGTAWARQNPKKGYITALFCKRPRQIAAAEPGGDEAAPPGVPLAPVAPFGSFPKLEKKLMTWQATLGSGAPISRAADSCRY